MVVYWSLSVYGGIMSFFVIILLLITVSILLIIMVLNSNNYKAKEKELLMSLESDKRSKQADDISGLISIIDNKISAPMSVLHGYLLIAGGEPDLPFSVRKNLDTANDTASMIEHSISKLLAVKRWQEPEFIPDLEPVNLSTLIVNICREQRQRALQRGITLTYEIDISLYHTFLTDFDIIKNSLTALIDNSVTYTLQGSVSIGARRVDELTEIIIHDTGVGIDEKNVEYYFNSEHKLLNSNDGHTGLGIPLARSGFSVLNGSITCESTLKQATMLKISLPLTLEKIGGENELEDIVKRVLLCVNLPCDLVAEIKNAGNKVFELDDVNESLIKDMAHQNSIDFIIVKVKDCSVVESADFPSACPVIVLAESGTLSKSESENKFEALPVDATADEIITCFNRCESSEIGGEDDDASVTPDKYLDLLVEESDIASLINFMSMAVIFGDLDECEASLIRLSRLLPFCDDLIHLTAAFEKYDFRLAKSIVARIALQNQIVLLGDRHV